MHTFSISGNIVGIIEKEIYWGTVHVQDGKINSIEKLEMERKDAPYLMPGFIDSHVHIESSMLVPAEFARLAVVHGTVGTISDPHEIANVCGVAGVRYMIENAATVPFKCRFGAPSCVPATVFETAGATIGPDEVESLLRIPEILYLSEMMNFPGVLSGDPDVMAKIAAAVKIGKPVDGHAPGLRGEQALRYIQAGISTDHECFTAEEALDKLRYGMKILIREGSAARNFDALAELLNDHEDRMMFCSDDKHPDSLAKGHINELCARAVAKGIGIFKILKAACINPVLHYKMDVGTLQIGDAADFILVSDLTRFDVLQTYIDGRLVADKGVSMINTDQPALINRFDCRPVSPDQFRLANNGRETIDVIEALDGQLITPHLKCTPRIEDGCIVSDTENDIIKIAVINRYHTAPPAIAFVKNFGLKTGAIASSVAHDSHNIVVAGVSDEDICKAANAVIACGGGIAAVCNEEIQLLPLPIAGLMSDKNGYDVATAYTAIDKFSKETLGSTLKAPFMTLSFMALLVIPSLKLSDKGLFDGNRFCLID